MKLREALCTGNARYRAAEPLKPVGVVLHSIGTPQPRAQVLHDYWQRDAGPYVVHYVLDDAEALRCMPENYKCWHVGAPGNSRYLGIEMCEPKQLRYTSGARFTVSDPEAARAYARKTYENAVELIAALCAAYGWLPEDAVFTHNELTVKKLSATDHVDPEHLWNGLELGYTPEGLRRDVRAAMGKPALAPDAPEPSEPPAQPEPAPPAQELYRVRKTWADAKGQIGAYRSLENAKNACPAGFKVFDSAGRAVWPEDAFTPYIIYVTPKDGLNVRSGPGTSYPIVNALEQGGAYTVTAEQDGWGLLKAYAAARNGWIRLAYTERLR